ASGRFRCRPCPHQGRRRARRRTCAMRWGSARGARYANSGAVPGALSTGSQADPLWRCAKPYLVIALALFALTRCGPSWTIVGVREGMTREEAFAAVYTCKQSLPPPTPTNNPGVALGDMYNRDDLLRACLRGARNSYRRAGATRL